MAHAAAAIAGGGYASRTPPAAAEFTRVHQTKRRLEPEDESENRSPEPTGAGESPSEAGEARNAPPEQRQAAARAPPEMPEALSENVTPSNEAKAKAKKKRMRGRAAVAAVVAAMGVGRKETLTTAEADDEISSQASSAARLPRRKGTRCPVFGCTRKHAPDNCPTFRDMTPKERLDLKQLCLFCLRHLMGKECDTMGKWPNCTIDGCGKPHHEMLHEDLKAGKPSALVKGAEPPSNPLATATAGEAPVLMAHLRELLEGLGIDPDALEVRIRAQRPGEQGRPHDGGGAAGPAAIEIGGRKLSGRLLEAFSLLSQAGEIFVSCMGESRPQMIESISSAETPGEAAPEERGRPEVREKGHIPWREEERTAGPVPTVQGTAEGAAIGGGSRRGAESGGRAAARRGVQDKDEGAPAGGGADAGGWSAHRREGLRRLRAHCREPSGGGAIQSRQSNLQTPLMLE